MKMVINSTSGWGKICVTLCLGIILISMIMDIKVFGQLADLYLSRQSIQLQVNNLQKQLTDVKKSKLAMFGMKEASNIIVSNGQSISGINPADISSIRDESQEQYNEFERYEKTLQMKLAVLQRSLEIIAMNLTSANGNLVIKRFSSNAYGSSYIMPNGTLYYIGKVDPTVGTHGTSGFNTAYTSKVPLKVDVSPLNGDLITQIYSLNDAFFAVTSKNDIYHWGGNSDGFGFTSATGYSGASTVMRKLDFGSFLKPIVPKKIICDQSLQNTVVQYCYMLSTDGELFFWGVWNYVSGCYSNVGNSCTGPFLKAVTNTYWYSTAGTLNNFNRPRKFKIMVNGTEIFASDFALCQNTGTYRMTHTICIINRDDSTQLFCNGVNTYGTFGDGTANYVQGYVQMEDLFTTWVASTTNPSAKGETFSQIYGAYKTMYAVGSTGKLYSWGNNDGYIGRTATASEPLNRIGATSFADSFIVTKVCTGVFHQTIVLVNEKSEAYVLGVYNGETFNTPYMIEQFKGKKFVECDFNENVQSVLFSNGQIYSKGNNNNYQFNAGWMGSATLFQESFLPVYYQN